MLWQLTRAELPLKNVRFSECTYRDEVSRNFGHRDVENTFEDLEMAGTYDGDDIANLLKASTRHVSRLADSGRMPRPMHIGRLVRWQKDIIDSWIANGCPPVNKSTKGNSR